MVTIYMCPSISKRTLQSLLFYFILVLFYYVLNELKEMNTLYIPKTLYSLLV